MAKYGNDSLDLLIGAKRIRTRPASMLGSSGIDGARHGFTEIYGNALDEASSGYGTKLEVKYYQDGSVSVRDYGRGVPLGWNDKYKNWNWHIVYNELYGGGKYSNGQWYLRSIGQWSTWNKNDTDFGSVVRVLEEQYGIKFKSIPEDGSVHTVNDLEYKYENGVLSLHIVHSDWSKVTWEFLNERLNYLASVGLNGLGAASTQYTSEFFEVKSYRDGKCTSRSFKKGIPLVNGQPFDMFNATKKDIEKIEEEIEVTDEPNGTFIHWKPDTEVFSEVNIGGDWLFDICKNIANVAGMELIFDDEKDDIHQVLPAGNIERLVIEHSGEGNIATDDSDEPVVITAKGFSHGHIKVEGKDFVYVCKTDIAFSTVENEIKNECFHNSVKMNSGIQYDALNDAIAQFMTDKGKKRSIKLDKSDWSGLICAFVSSYSNYASFRNQTKDAIDDNFMYSLIYDTFLAKMNEEYAKDNIILVNAVDIACQRAEYRILSKENSKSLSQINKLKREKQPEKFVSCAAFEKKEYDKAELWITEGDSALGGVKNARNKDFQAIYPIRGKALNVLKANLQKILQNQEIRDIFALLGTGIDINAKGQKTFNIEDLRFDKIIFATDADEDGYQIRVLLFVLFYKLAPELIKQGHVYIAETPRFKIDMLNGGVMYALNDDERDKILEEKRMEVLKVNRFKGLGEVNKEVLRETTVHPDTRNLIQLTCDLKNPTERNLIDALFGADKHHQRKALITSVLGLDYNDFVDDEEDGMLVNNESISDEDTDEELV